MRPALRRRSAAPIRGRKAGLGIGLAAALTASLLVLSCATAPRPSFPAGEEAALMAGASRRDEGGVPIVRLRGGPRQVGYQYGALLAPELGRALGEFDSILDAAIGTGLKRRAAEALLSRLARKTLALLPERYAEELEGVAAGSGRPYREILLLALTPELLFDANCSSLATRDSGRLVHARNFDFYFPANAVSRFLLVARYEIEGRVPFVNIGFVGLFGSYTGANDAGLSATEDTAVFSRKAKGASLPVGYALRMVLESSRSLADARAVLAGARCGGYLVTVSSLADNDASVFELVNGRTLENRMEGERIRVANRCLSPENRRGNQLVIGDFDFNTAREEALDRALDAPTTDPLARARAALADRSYRGVAALPPQQSLLQDSIRTVNNFTTIQSVVLDPAGRAAHVSWAPGYAASGAYLRVGLDDLATSPSFPADGLLESPEWRATSAFVAAMHAELMARALSFGKADYERLYPRVAAAGLPPLPKAEWRLDFAARTGRRDEALAAARELEALLPGSYYGPFQTGLALLGLGRAEEAAAALGRAAATEGLSPMADFAVSVYLAEAESRLGDAARAAGLRARAAAILARYEYREGLGAKLRSYFADPLLAEAAESLGKKR